MWNCGWGGLALSKGNHAMSARHHGAPETKHVHMAYGMVSAAMCPKHIVCAKPSHFCAAARSI